MEEKFNWDLPADPDPKSDNYYNGIVSKELKGPSNVVEVLLGVIHRESVTNQSDFVNEGIQSILDQFGIKTDKPLTRKEKLLAFIGFKAGSMWEKLVEDQRQSEPASPNPLEIVMMGLLKTNGKKMLILSYYLPQKYYICSVNKNLHNYENSKIGTYRHSNGIRGGSLHFLQSFG